VTKPFFPLHVQGPSLQVVVVSAQIRGELHGGLVLRLATESAAHGLRLPVAAVTRLQVHRLAHHTAHRALAGGQTQIDRTRRRGHVGLHHALDPWRARSRRIHLRFRLEHLQNVHPKKH